jgi:hypothetical protein
MLASIGDLEARAHGNHIGPSGELLIHLYHASMIATTFPRLVGQHAGTLDTLIRKFTAHRATDPRDKIYSLLGIAEPYSNATLAVDYTSPWLEVFRTTTKYIIEGSQSLNILCLAASECPELPSWAPNFAKQNAFDHKEELNRTLPDTVHVDKRRFVCRQQVEPKRSFLER